MDHINEHSCKYGESEEVGHDKDSQNEDRSYAKSNHTPLI